MEIQKLHFGHRQVCLYHLVQGAAPLVYSIDYHENGQLLLKCRALGLTRCRKDAKLFRYSSFLK